MLEKLEMRQWNIINRTVLYLNSTFAKAFTFAKPYDIYKSMSFWSKVTTRRRNAQIRGRMELYTLREMILCKAKQVNGNTILLYMRLIDIY